MLQRAACLLAALVAGWAQTDTPEALEARAERAYLVKDYSTFLLLEKQILTLTPGDPRALYNAASAQALLEHPVEAVQLLDQLLGLHIDLGAEKDPDFTGIRKTPEWNRYADHLAAMRKPVEHSTVAFTLPEAGLLASSVAIDETRGDAYVGSLRKRKILKRTKAGEVSDFASEKDGLWSVSSLLIDVGRKLLFASAAALPFMQNFHKEDEGKSGIFAFDLATGKLVRSATLAIPGEHHSLAQMVEDRDGNVFVVDTASSEVRRLRRSSSELELFISSVVFKAPRGLALSVNERTLYVMDLATGLWAVDVLSIDRRQIHVPADIWLGGMIGLLRTADGFVSLQAGVQPNRVVKIRLDDKRENVTSLETLESNNSLYDGPMPGSLTGSDLFYIANNQFSLIDPETNAFAAGRARETVVLRLPIGK